MADVRTEMSSFLTKLNGEGSSETSEEPSKNEPEKSADADENQLESDSPDSDEKPDTEEPKEDKVEAKDEDEDDKEDKKDKESDKDQKKPNRYQRLKSQRDEAVAQSKKFKDEFYKAVKVASAWRAEALTFEKELQRIEEEAKSTGYERSQEKKQLFDYERERVGRQVDDEFAEKVQKETGQEQVKQFVAQLREKFTEEATDLGDKYGVPPKKILVALHTYRSTGENVSMEDVAKELGEIAASKRRKTGQERQIAANSSAPKVIKGGKGVGVDYPATPEGMERYLKAQGLA